MTDLAPSLDVAYRVRCAVEAVLSRQAIELRVLHLEPVCDFTDYFVVCSGSSSRQVDAIADWVGERLKALRVRPLHVEGKRLGRWILMDYGDFLVHVFDPERRDFYRLEDVWSDAADVTAQFADQTIGAADQKIRAWE